MSNFLSSENYNPLKRICVGLAIDHVSRWAGFDKSPDYVMQCRNALPDYIFYENRLY
jgi:hypothetical protein